MMLTRCSESNPSTPCLDQCNGYEGNWTLSSGSTDGYLYRYFITGPYASKNGKDKCSTDIWDANTCSGTYQSRYYPFTPICMRGCTDVSGITGGSLNPSCSSVSSSSGTDSSTIADTNLLSTLNVYTGVDSCNCNDGTPTCIQDTTTGFYVDVTASSDVLSSDSELLTIAGTNFAETLSNNQVTLTSSVGNDVKATVLSSTSELIVLELHQLSQANHDASLSAEVVSTISLSGTSSGSPVEVAKIVSANPSVMASTSLLSSDTAMLTIKGMGFEASQTSSNSVGFTSTSGSPVKASTILTTMTSLAVSFTHLSPSNVGSLEASVTVLSTWSGSSTTGVAKVVAANPSVIESTSLLSSDTAMLTIKGMGFEASQTSSNSVGFVSSGSDSPTGVVKTSTLTSLVVTFTHLSPSESPIVLSSTVTVLSTWSSLPAVTVAKVFDASTMTTSTEAATTTSTASPTTTSTEAATTTSTASPATTSTEAATTTTTAFSTTTTTDDATTTTESVVTTASDGNNEDDNSSSSSDDSTVVIAVAAAGGVVAVIIIVVVGYWYGCAGGAKPSTGVLNPRHALDHVSCNTPLSSSAKQGMHEL